MKSSFGWAAAPATALWMTLLAGCPQGQGGPGGLDLGNSDMSVLHVGLLDLGHLDPHAPRPEDLGLQDLAMPPAGLGLPTKILPGRFTQDSFATPVPVAGYSTGATDKWMVGNAGLILHSTDTNWMFVPSPTQQNLSAVWGSGPADVYAVGTQILHYKEVAV